MTEIPFSGQVFIFIKEMRKVFDYVDLEEVYNAKLRMRNAGEILDDDIPVFICFASYVGALKRIAYYKYVHKLGFDVRALADACVLTFMFNDVYRFEFQPYLRRKEIRSVIDRTSYPEWTKIGLIGGSTSDIKKYGDKFAEEMEAI